MKMKAIKVKGKNIEVVLDYIKLNDYLNSDYYIQKNPESIIIPLTNNAIINKKTLDSEFELIEIDESEFKQKEKKLDFKKEVEKILSDSEKSYLKTAYDIVGEIAILEIDEILSKKSKEIGKILLLCNTNIKTVVRKKGAHKGELRIQKYEILAGKKSLNTVHKENNCNLELSLDKVYYSTRSSTERKRIAESVKKGEDVLVMFSGAGPFVCVISKNSKANTVTGIELNKEGHELALKSSIRNKLKNVILINGDVKEVCPVLKNENKLFDRIIMPLPKTAEKFLPEAFLVCKNNTIIHLYDFVEIDGFPKNVEEKIKYYCNKYNLNYKILNAVKCGQFSPSIFRVCIDFQIILNK